MVNICSAQRAESQYRHLRGTKARIHRLIQLPCISLSVTPEVIRLSTAQPWQKSVFCVASKDTKQEIVVQVDEDQEDKIRMVTLCNVVK